MPEYLQRPYSRTSYFEGSVIAVAYLKLYKFPEHLSEREVWERKVQEELKQALRTEANKATHYLSAGLLELKPEVTLREGCLIVEILLQLAEHAPLGKLLSQSFLQDIGLWALTLKEEVLEGIKVGSRLYIAHRTFKALMRLESEVRKVLPQLIGAIKYVLRLTIRDILNRSAYSETSTGILGVLARLYKDSQVAKGNSDIRKRLPSMKRVVSDLAEIEITVKNAKDRSSLCDLLKVILSEISEVSLKGARNQRELSKKEEFNFYLDRSQFMLNFLCKAG